LPVLEGSAREAIPQTARARGEGRHRCHGALSRSGLRRLFVGNTAEAVLDAARLRRRSVVKPGRFQTKGAAARPRRPAHGAAISHDGLTNSTPAAASTLEHAARARARRA
jgi:hypothetical protein